MRFVAVARFFVQAVVVFAALAVPPAFAADAPIGGSWVASCPQATMHGFTLVAQCRDTSGALHTTTLDLLSCGQPATAGNVNGVLVCESGNRRQTVAGSWVGSCANERIAGLSLSAQCLDGSGNKVHASLNLSGCAQPVVVTNVNGQLVCNGGGGGAGAGGSRFITLNTPPTTANGLPPAVEFHATNNNPPPVLDLPVPGSRVIILHTDPPSGTGSRVTQLVPVPAPGAPSATAGAATGPLNFGGTWNITPDLGKGFVLVLKDTGNGVTGDADVEGSHIRLSGTPAGAHLDAVWQVNASNGPITGSVTFDLSPDRNQLSATLRVTGTFGDARHWSGVRQGSGVAAASLPSGTTGIPGVTGAGAGASTAGFVTAVVNRSVSVRNKPSMSGSIVLRTLSQGTQVSVQCDRSWCALSTGDGFVSKGFLNLQAAAATPPPDLAPPTGTATLSNGTPVVANAGQTPIVQQQGTGAAAMLGCNQRATVKSKGDGGPGQVALTFHNTSTGARHLVWVNYDGGDVAYGDIAPGAFLTQQTFEGHVWELTDDQGRCTLLFAAGSVNQTMNLH